MLTTAAGVPRAREQETIRQHLPLVHHVVAGMSSRLPRHVPLDALVSAGMLGLLQAARGFDEHRGVPFSAYATGRIRGAVLDELRGADRLSRSVRQKARSLQQAEDSLGTDLQAAAAAAGLSVEEARQVRADVHRSQVSSLDALPSADHHLGATSGGGPSPERSLLDRERIGYLRDAIDALPERLRYVVIGTFFEERTLAELAGELGVTESRISHMRAEATSLLREALHRTLADDAPDPSPARPVAGVAARRRAAYCATVTSASDYRSRLDRPAPVAAVPA